ncbi:Arginine-tRNA protein transferase 1 [Hibiscus syriacus]|uniref:Arginine-tRNA protein transferase 1 n=1 Tax=Hibiscus syriacus TaxID=106335 RepID=A0A6A2ZXL9_HIBSY|nr:Arginine-tRNA protein transferase 1 [Hibiscus syriacus]
MENKSEEFMHHLSNQIDKVVNAYIESGEFPSGIQFPKAVVKMVSHAKRKLAVEGSEYLLYTSNIAFQIAATLRRTLSAERDNQQSRMSRHSAEVIDLCPKSIAEKASSDRDVQIVALPGEFGSGSQSRSVKKSSEYRHGKKRKLEIRLKRSSFDPEEYALYKQYQIKVHNDPPDRVTESSYRRFLVNAPLFFVSHLLMAWFLQCGFGSFHQQYIIDGKLVAVGVVDVLPRCLSSIYSGILIMHFYHWVNIQLCKRLIG